MRTKLIDIDALLDCLTDSMGGIQIQTGILPSNIISLTIRDDSRYAVVEFPDEYADITYMSTTYEHFPLYRACCLDFVWKAAAGSPRSTWGFRRWES